MQYLGHKRHSEVILGCDYIFANDIQQVGTWNVEGETEANSPRRFVITFELYRIKVRL